MVKNKLVSPFIKWVGGKRQLLPEIKKLLPVKLSGMTYYEPFIGGGALLFDLQPKKAVINDYNEELINVYRVIKEHPQKLIEKLKSFDNTAEVYYHVRSMDRAPLFHDLTNIERAARIIFLNKTCYNGLYRVNNAGEFNVPFGKYKNPNIVNEPVIKAVSNYLNSANITIVNGDYEKVLDKISSINSFVYLDPPYHPVSESSNFTGYVKGGWDEKDQLRLRNVCRTLNSKGIKFLLSNSSTDFIKDIYSEFEIHIVKANRYVNSIATKRGLIEEVLVRNYE